MTSGLKIDNRIVTDKDVIEKEVVGFFTALFNGHHGKDLVNTGVPFVPDWSSLDDFLTLTLQSYQIYHLVHQVKELMGIENMQGDQGKDLIEVILTLQVI